MLSVQEYLLQNGLHKLRDELAIQVVEHPAEPLVILNYHQFDSPKMHPVVRQCRGITLEKESWKVVAKAFDRFFNWGELAHEMAGFDWSDFICQTKEDGSLILVYHYRGTWRVNTRGSFGQDIPRGAPGTWAELVWSRLGDPARLDPALTYVLELVSPYTKVVRRYPDVHLYLLTAFVMGPDDPAEVPHPEADRIAARLGLARPRQHAFQALDQITSWLLQQEVDDPTFEGVVIRDRRMRWKIKSRSYLGLHLLATDNTGGNPRLLLPFILNGEDAELLAYFPEIKEVYLGYKARVEAEYDKLKEVWQATRHLKDQKEFALAVLPRTRFASLLFALRKRLPAEQQTEDELRQQWKLAEPQILEWLKK